MPRYLMELVGTLFFVLTIGLTVLGSSDLAPLAVGAAFAIVVCLGRRVSAGHCNPAITLAAFLRTQIDAIEAVKFMVLQLAGAIIAGFATIWLAGDALTFTPGIGVGAWQALGVEFLFTFILVLVFLETGASGAGREGTHSALLVGLAAFAGMTAAIDISGGALNPAAVLGMSIAATVTGGSSLGGVWLYLLAPLVGGMAAALISRQLSP